ncbi:MAG: methionyl-tRNA formyltransferase [Ignavibacteria bacterium]|jgi:methionyl-tRNA formyltransferase
MNIIFFGTPDFAVPSLKTLLKSKHDVKAVVTAPDKERGRGQKVTFTPVKKFAIENNIPVLQPEKLNDGNFIEELKKINADLFIIVAFRILPVDVFTVPPEGSFNLHGSLLPKYRGAAPIQWALINGDEKTGLTTFFLKEKVDTGNILLQKEILIDELDNFQTLHDEMSEEGAKLVLETVNLIESGTVEVKSQDDSVATKAPKITKDICKIDWNKTAKEIHNLVRGLSPVPGAFFIYDEKIYKVYKTKINRESTLQPGEIIENKDQLIIGCKSEAIEVLEIQPEGRKRMDIESFLRGYSITDRK